MKNEDLVLQEAAEAAERSGDLEAAFDVWQTLSSIDADRPDYLCKLGRVAQMLGRWAIAEQAFLDAIKVDIKRNSTKLRLHSFAMALLGSLFLVRADGDRWTNAEKAKAWLEHALALSPAPMYLTFLGVAHNRLGEREAAKDAFRKAIQLDESYEEAYFNLGLLLADDGQNDEAEKLLRKATQLDPNYHLAHGRLGILLHKQGRYSEAVTELRRAVEIDPTDKIARRYLSRMPGSSTGGTGQSH